MLSEEEKKLLKIFKSQVEKEETEYFSVNAYTQLLYDSHKTVLNLITKLQKENEEKDKQIDLMAGEIEYAGCIKKVWKCDQKNCKDCIKQYFKKLAKEKEE